MSLESINLREEIAELSACIEKSESYIRYLEERYANPEDTVKKHRELIKCWRKERYELEKELVVLENKA